MESYSITNESGFVPQNEQFENGGTMREADKRMYYIVSPNSFAYNPARINVGSIGYQNTAKNVIVSSLYEVFKTTEDIDDRLLWHWFKSPDFQKLIVQLQEGGVRLYFYYDKLCMGEVALPEIEEQRKIGQFLDTLDTLITLHQRMCVFLGSTLQIRMEYPLAFAWEQRKFADMATRNSGMAVCSSNIPSVEYEDIVSGQGILNKDIREKSNIRSGIRFEPGDVLFGKLRPYLKNWILPNFSGVAVGDFWVLHPFETDSRYLYYLIQTPAFQTAANQSTGTKMPRSDWNLVSKAIFFSPKDITEQRKIGATLQSIDHLITLHQRKPKYKIWRYYRC